MAHRTESRSTVVIGRQYDAELSAESSGAAGQPVDVVYIAGYGHSGSTILNILLNQHAGILGAGELFRLASAWQSNEYCSCGSRLPQCELWSKIVHRWSDLAETDPIRDYGPLQAAAEAKWAGATRDVAMYERLTRSLFAAAREVSGKSLIVDASKVPQRASALSRVDGINLYIVHLVRDARGVAWSMRRRLPQDIAAGLQTEKRGRSVARTALHWMASNIGVERLLSRLEPRRVQRITYERFVTAPGPALESIGDLCGVDLSDLSATVDANTPLRAGHVMAGNRLRMSGATVLRPDFRWQKDLPVFQRRLLELACLPLLHRYGYL